MELHSQKWIDNINYIYSTELILLMQLRMWNTYYELQDGDRGYMFARSPFKDVA